MDSYSKMDIIATRLDAALRARYNNISAVGVGSDRLYVYHNEKQTQEQKDLYSTFEEITVQWIFARFEPA